MMNIHQYGTLSIARDSLHVSMQLPHQPSTCNGVSHMIHLPKSTGFIREAQEIFHLGKKVQVKRDVACQLAGVFFFSTHNPHISHIHCMSPFGHGYIECSPCSNDVFLVVYRASRDPTQLSDRRI